MMQCQTPTARIVAALHDVVEDTDVTFEDLQREGFSDEVLAALRLVTHEPEVSYADYVVRCKPNATAREVKMSDLRDNASLDRALARPEKFQTDSARMTRYVLSYQFLAGMLSETDYRRLEASTHVDE